jgi:hypothetical protein
MIDSSFTYLQYTSNVQLDLENFQTVESIQGGGGVSS